MVCPTAPLSSQYSRSCRQELLAWCACGAVRHQFHVFRKVWTEGRGAPLPPCVALDPQGWRRSPATASSLGPESRVACAPPSFTDPLWPKWLGQMLRPFPSISQQSVLSQHLPPVRCVPEMLCGLRGAPRSARWACDRQGGNGPQRA